jgi:release factor glutamine methyltransferase
MISYKNLEQYFLDSVLVYDEIDEKKSILKIILEDLYQYNTNDLVLNKDLDIEFSEIDELIYRINLNEPLQHIIGFSYFMDLKFKVSPSVLIPRPETEELVSMTLELIKDSASVKILDIGSGSGCIPICLAKYNNNASVTSLDVSKDALEIAIENAKNNEVEVEFVLQDILDENFKFQETFDVIISNPPYVKNNEKPEIRANVLDFEPHLALFVEDDDPLIFYRKIAEIAQNNLTKNGLVAVEINTYLGNETVELFTKFGFKDVSLHQDFFGKDRFVLARN